MVVVGGPCNICRGPCQQAALHFPRAGGGGEPGPPAAGRPPFIETIVQCACGRGRKPEHPTCCRTCERTNGQRHGPICNRLNGEPPFAPPVAPGGGYGGAAQPEDPFPAAAAAFAANVAEIAAGGAHAQPAGGGPNNEPGVGSADPIPPQRSRCFYCHQQNPGHPGHACPARNRRNRNWNWPPRQSGSGNRYYVLLNPSSAPVGVYNADACQRVLAAYGGWSALDRPDSPFPRGTLQGYKTLEPAFGRLVGSGLCESPAPLFLE